MIKKGGSLRSMIGMVGLTEGSSDLKVIDAWISKLEKCESEDVTSSSHCLSPAYKGADCDPTAEASSDGVKRKSLLRTKPKRKNQEALWNARNTSRESGEKKERIKGGEKSESWKTISKAMTRIKIRPKPKRKSQPKAGKERAQPRTKPKRKSQPRTKQKEEPAKDEAEKEEPAKDEAEKEEPAKDKAEKEESDKDEDKSDTKDAPAKDIENKEESRIPKLRGGKTGANQSNGAPERLPRQEAAPTTKKEER